VRSLLGGIGYRNLRDHSIGVVAVDHLQCRDWPADLAVEDLSYNPIAVVQRLEDEPPDRRFTRLVVVAAVPRGLNRTAGAVTAYRWDGVLPPPEAIQAAVCEAVTGVIALDNTLVVSRHFGALPEEVVVVEVEPGVHDYGASFSPPVELAFQPLCELLSRLALDPEAAASLPLSSLGGAMVPAAELQ
jgi:hydrogenase maturation protease